MHIALRFVSFLLAAASFLGYAWWDRSDSNLVETSLFLSPAVALLMVGLIPINRLAFNAALRLAITVLCGVGTLSALRSVLQALGSPIEPDTAAAILHAFIAAVLAWSVVIVWRRHLGQGGAVPPASTTTQ